MPTSGSANAKRNSTTTSGELRKTVTHAGPIQRSGGTGDTRNAASTVPRIRAPTRGEQADAQGAEEPGEEPRELRDQGVHA